MIFYSPKNFKKGRHIGGQFRLIDILLLAIGSVIFIPMILYILTRDNINFGLFLIMLTLYGCIILLIQPFPPIYHNFLTFFQLLYSYSRCEKKYIWGGIVKYEEKEEYR